MISSARKSNTTNPFIIYNFLNQLEEDGQDSDSTPTTYACTFFFLLLNICIYIYLLMAMKNSFSLKNSTQFSYINFASAFMGKLLKRNEWQSQTSNALLFVFMEFEKIPHIRS